MNIKKWGNDRSYIPTCYFLTGPVSSRNEVIKYLKSDLCVLCDRSVPFVFKWRKLKLLNIRPTSFPRILIKPKLNQNLWLKGQHPPDPKYQKIQMYYQNWMLLTRKQNQIKNLQQPQNLGNVDRRLMTSPRSNRLKSALDLNLVIETFSIGIFILFLFVRLDSSLSR